MNLMKLLYPIVLIFGLSFTGYSQSKDYIYSAKLQSYLNAIHLKKGFNGELLIAKGENILFQETVGLASYEYNLELNKGAKYRIASITKTFTAALIAIAQEEKKLIIHDKAIRYISGLSSKFKDITIEQLLSHTSGLPHNEAINDYWLTKSKLQMTHEQIIKEINALDLLFEPGSEKSYSSLGYYILASIVEDIYGNSFEELLKNKILDNLQMRETGVVDNLKIIPQMAFGYHLLTDDSLVVAPYRNYSMLKGAGDMYSTVVDLLKWNNSFFSYKLLNQKLKAAFVASDSKPGVNSGDNYGLGWFINSNKPLKYFHGGGTWGYSTHTAMYPDEQISIIILSNVSTLSISSIADDVEKIVFEKPFQMPTVDKVINKSINLEKYAGIFISDSSNLTLNITSNNKRIYAKLGSNPMFEIYPKGNHRFFGKKVEIEFTFETTNDLITGLSAERMGQTFHFKKDSK